MLALWISLISAVAAPPAGAQPTTPPAQTPASPPARPPGPEMIPEEDLDLVGRTAPDFEAVMFDGNTAFKLSETRGKPVVLAFWASWCGPCRAELPALSDYQKAHPEIVIYAVNVDTDRNKAQGFLRKVKFDLPIVWDNQAIEFAGQYSFNR